MKHITVVTPCYNEEDNVRPLYQAVAAVFSAKRDFTFEHLFIDNCSRDETADVLRALARENPNVKVIFNARNFGHIRSPFYGLIQAQGDAAVLIACDFQDPPELINEFLIKWGEGYKVVVGIKTAAAESKVMFTIRTLYYRLVNRLADVELTSNMTGFGLYDRQVIQTLRLLDDPYPYFRGLIADIGYESAKITYHQPKRARGLTKNNFYTLYDLAMLGITNHSRVPLRIATMAGFLMATLSLLVALSYLAAKLLFWNFFSVGIAPLIISLFFFSSVQLFFIGIIGEYVGAILTQVQKRPLVIERERINF